MNARDTGQRPVPRATARRFAETGALPRLEAGGGTTGIMTALAANRSGYRA